ncbi:MAG: hypothetical protein NTX66_03320, partial [Candidatus Falkowbacteria bacterium]|nr:hypothetical protein [Candidatus Falkowbacteria bacterium]
IINGIETCDGSGSFPCTKGVYTGTATCNPPSINPSCQTGTCDIYPKKCSYGLGLAGVMEDGEQCGDNGVVETPCTWNGFTGIKGCLTNCLWGNCSVVPSCGSNRGGNFENLTPQNQNNCLVGIVKEFSLHEDNTWTWNCEGTAADFVSCSAQKQVSGACGPATQSAQATEPTGKTYLCSSGTDIGMNYNHNSLPYKYEWECEGDHGGSPVNCSTPKCGDGVITSPQEQCDFGSNNDDTNGCGSNCHLGNYKYTCNSLPTPQTYDLWNSVSFYKIPCLEVNQGAKNCKTLASSPATSTTTYNIEESVSSCRFKCAGNWGKCSGDTSCQTALTELTNCGTCNNICSSGQGCYPTSPPGSNYACSCYEGYDHCDGGPSCQTLSADPNCGTCHHNCSADSNKHQGCSSFSPYDCVCQAGFKNCSGNPATGCETNITFGPVADVNCGNCGTSCKVGSNGQQGYCSNGYCDCNAGYVWSSGQCVPGSCGDGKLDKSLGEQCEPGVTPVENGTCVPKGDPNECKIIDTSFCDVSEILNLYNNTENINFACSKFLKGGAGYTRVCLTAGDNANGKRYCSDWNSLLPVFTTTPYANINCNSYPSGYCGYKCTNNFDDCVQNPGDYDTCETDLKKDPNCGSCGNNCLADPTKNQTCGLTGPGYGCVCKSLDFGDCNGGTDGCETALNTNPEHCGLCATNCGGPNAVCTNRSCKGCKSGYVKANGVTCTPSICGDNYVDTSRGEQCEPSIPLAGDLRCYPTGGSKECKIYKLLANCSDSDYLGGLIALGYSNIGPTSSRITFNCPSQSNNIIDCSVASGSTCINWNTSTFVLPQYTICNLGSNLNNCSYNCQSGWGNCNKTWNITSPPDPPDLDTCEINLNTSNSHCGSCPNNCGSHGSCSSGSCVCDSGWSSCGGGNCNTSDNDNHCGCSGLPCKGKNPHCSNGGCVCVQNCLN